MDEQRLAQIEATFAAGHVEQTVHHCYYCGLLVPKLVAEVRRRRAALDELETDRMTEQALATLIKDLELSWDEDLCPESCSCHDSVGPLLAEVRRLQAENQALRLTYNGPG